MTGLLMRGSGPGTEVTISEPLSPRPANAGDECDPAGSLTLGYNEQGA